MYGVITFSPINYQPLSTSLQKKWDFWTVLNRPEIGKNRLKKGPDGFFWTVLNRPG
jgi:hypothetical protein